MKRTFVDANVLLEILLGRSLAQQCVTLLGDSEQQYIISVLTVHIVWYIAEKYKLDQDKVDDILAPWEVLPITAHTINSARGRYAGKDFEDCLQATCAEHGECSRIVTIDKNFQRYSNTELNVTVITPAS